MTSIVLWMWLADFAGAVTVVSISAGIALSLGVIGSAMAAAVNEDIEILKRTIFLMWPLTVLVAVGCVMPSSSTIRLIAAGQAISVAADTELGKKSVEAIDAILTKIMNGAKK